MHIRFGSSWFHSETGFQAVKKAFFEAPELFADGEVIRIGSELNGSFNPPLPAGGKSLKILFIGNSFTVDATEHLPGMLKSAGITHVRMVRAYHGGYKLPEFFENYAAPDICTYYYCEPGAGR